MAVFRNVMAFLGLDDDDQLYDDDFIEEDEDEAPRATGRSAGRSGRGDAKTISLDDRFQGENAQPTFGFSTETGGEAGGVGAVRPLRPVPNATPIEVPDALSADRSAADRSGSSRSESSRSESSRSGSGGFDDPSAMADAPAPDRPDASGHQGADSQMQRRRAGADSRGAFEGGGLDRPVPPPGEPLRESLREVDSTGTSARRDRPVSSPPTLRTVEENEPPVVTNAKPRLHIPSSFDDASRIADDFRTGSPVVMNLTKVDKPVARRLVDFASGVCYVLAGGMERLAPNVYLLTPTGVDVSSEDRRRMQERGFDR